MRHSSRRELNPGLSSENDAMMPTNRLFATLARLANISGVFLVSALFLTPILLSQSVQASPALAATLSHDGYERDYLLYVPASATVTAAKKPRALVMVLHGGGGRPSQIEWATHSEFNKLADTHGFIVVYPAGIKRGWNDGRGDQLAFPERAKINDISYLHALIDQINQQIPIDPKRVFATGISNGGMMALRLACESGRFRAVAPVAASLPKDLAQSCRPARVSVLLLNGTDDNFVPFNGGFVNGVRKTNERGQVISAVDTFELFGKANTCQAPTSHPLRDLKNDDTTISRHEFSDCADGVRIVQYRIQGGGHTWPGARTRIPKFLVGNSSREINATDEIWRFFSTL
ncbi:MAG: PHB depolymerase family esterase [Burkholderiaceae bacterium]